MEGRIEYHSKLPESLHNAIKELFLAHAPDVEAAIYYLCYSDKSRKKIAGYDPDDLAQELLIKAVKALEYNSYNPTRPFKPFINTVLKNHTITIYHKAMRSQDVLNTVELYELLDSDQDIDE